MLIVAIVLAIIIGGSLGMWLVGVVATHIHQSRMMRDMEEEAAARRAERDSAIATTLAMLAERDRGTHAHRSKAA